MSLGTKRSFAVHRMSVAATILTLTAGLLLGPACPSAAQNPVRRSAGTITPLLPTVPQQDSRPAEGPGANQQWQTARPEADNAPIASFIDTLKGNDSALQLVVGQGRLLTLKEPIAKEGEEGLGVIAVGDPTIVDFNFLPHPRMIRLIGKRAGVTDLSITTTDGQAYNFEVHVGYDLTLMRAQLRQMFPDALIKLGQIREHLVVEGQARSPRQVARIIQALQAYLASVQTSAGIPGGGGGGAPASQRYEEMGQGETFGEDQREAIAVGEEGERPSATGTVAAAQIINLLRVPGVQQVMLKVQIAELNRQALREIGADITIADGSTFIQTLLGNTPTLFAVFDGGDVDLAIQALRRNSVVSVLAEPNLVAMNGQKASFLAGGEYPVPVPQQIGGGGSSTVTVEFRPFGVQLAFIPYVLDDENVRLVVAPEVSTIDENLSTTLVDGGDPVPGTRNRRAETTVELRQGQTLAIAGLINTELDAGSTRIPLVGDLPYVGPLFSNTTHQRTEQELLVLVTPFLIHPMDRHQVGPLPGSEVCDPDDHEFYLLNRIEGCRDCSYRSTTGWDRPLHHQHQRHLEQQYPCGPVGYSQ